MREGNNTIQVGMYRYIRDIPRMESVKLAEIKAEANKRGTAPVKLKVTNTKQSVGH